MPATQLSVAELRTELADKVSRAGTTGNVWYVGSTVSTASDSALPFGTTPENPLATLDYAIGQCTANQGDIIYVMPGHTETLTAAAQLVFDVAGVKVIGLGVGTNRPTFTLSTATTADVDIDATNVWIDNIRFVSGIDSLAVVLDVNSANFSCTRCDFVSSSGNEIINQVNFATTVDDFYFADCYFFQPTDPDGTNGGTSTGCFYIVDSENILIERCRFNGFFETAIFHNDATLCGELWIKECWGNQELLAADTITLEDGASGGMVNCNWLQENADDVTETLFMTFAATTPFGMFNTFFMNDNGGGGNLALDNTADTT